MTREFEEFHMGGGLFGKIIFLFAAILVLIKLLMR